jgi:chromosome segregation ATPase
MDDPVIIKDKLIARVNSESDGSDVEGPSAGEGSTVNADPPKGKKKRRRRRKNKDGIQNLENNVGCLAAASAQSELQPETNNERIQPETEFEERYHQHQAQHQAQLEEVSEKCQELDEVYESTVESMTELVASYKTLKKKYETSQSFNKLYFEKVRTLNFDATLANAVHQTEVTDLQKVVEDCKKREKNMDVLLESTKLEVTGLENRLKARANESTEKDDLIQDLRSQLQNKALQLEAKVVQMQDLEVRNVEEIKRRSKDEQTRVTDLEVRLAKAESNANLKDEIIQDLRQKLEDKGSQLEAKVVEMQDLENRNQKRVTDLKALLAKAESNAEQWKNNGKLLVNNLEARLEIAEKSVRASGKQHNAYQGRITELEDSQCENERQIKGLEDALKAKNADIIAYIKQNESYVKQIEQLTPQCQETIEEKLEDVPVSGVDGTIEREDTPMDEAIETEYATVFQVKGKTERRISKIDSCLQMLVQLLYLTSIFLMVEFHVYRQSNYAPLETTCGDWIGSELISVNSNTYEVAVGNVTSSWSYTSPSRQDLIASNVAMVAAPEPSPENESSPIPEWHATIGTWEAVGVGAVVVLSFGAGWALYGSYF